MASSTTLKVNKDKVVHLLTEELDRLNKENTARDKVVEKREAERKAFIAKYEKKYPNAVVEVRNNHYWNAPARDRRYELVVTFSLTNDEAKAFEELNDWSEDQQRKSAIEDITQYLRTLELVDGDVVPLTGMLKGVSKYI